MTASCSCKGVRIVLNIRQIMFPLKILFREIMNYLTCPTERQWNEYFLFAFWWCFVWKPGVRDSLPSNLFLSEKEWLRLGKQSGLWECFCYLLGLLSMRNQCNKADFPSLFLSPHGYFTSAGRCVWIWNWGVCLHGVKTWPLIGCSFWSLESKSCGPASQRGLSHQLSGSSSEHTGSP